MQAYDNLDHATDLEINLEHRAMGIVISKSKWMREVLALWWQFGCSKIFFFPLAIWLFGITEMLL